MLFFGKKKPPGERQRQKAALCRLAADLARQEGDPDHAGIMETMAKKFDGAALYEVWRDRERRAGVIPWSFD